MHIFAVNFSGFIRDRCEYVVFCSVLFCFVLFYLRLNITFTIVLNYILRGKTKTIRWLTKLSNIVYYMQCMHVNKHEKERSLAHMWIVECMLITWTKHATTWCARNEYTLYDKHVAANDWNRNINTSRHRHGMTWHCTKPIWKYFHSVSSLKCFRFFSFLLFYSFPSFYNVLLLLQIQKFTSRYTVRVYVDYIYVCI